MPTAMLLVSYSTIEDIFRARRKLTAAASRYVRDAAAGFRALDVAFAQHISCN
jgi:hypothetical protein